MAGIGELYDSIYRFFCGGHPVVKPWHFQWLSLVYLCRDLERTLPRYGGRVLDVGCGDKPYQAWFGPVSKYVGLDVKGEKGADITVNPEEPWPLESESFDTVLCTQVIEHVAPPALAAVLGEVDRVLVPGGHLILSLPYIYNGHDEPRDYRRLSVHGAAALFPRWGIIELRGEGAVGSTVGQLLLNWIDTASCRRRTTRYLKALLLPVWIILSAFVNLLAYGFDKIDGTGSFYSNVFMVVRKERSEEEQVQA